MFGVAAANLVEYPVLVIVYRRFGFWMWKLDVVFGLIVVAASVTAAWRYYTQLGPLA